MLIGREPELERLEELLEGARSSRGGALLVRGEPGIGKTALLGAIAERSEGLGVLTARGLESEAELPFSALAELIEPLLAALSELPAPQRAAIEGALALGPPAIGDRFATCAGLHRLVCSAARDRPLLLLIDDVQWLDSASAECIGFMARRLERTPVALVAAARSDEQPAVGVEGLDHVLLERLEPEAARSLLRRRHANLSEAATEAILEAAAGNPLALIELPAAIGEGADPSAPMIAPSQRLHAAFSNRLAPLSRDARTALLVAAAAWSRSLGPIAAACQRLDLDPRALEEAEEHRLVNIAPESIEFAHPLLRGTVYESAPAKARREAHRALAESVGAEERGWHLAAAAIGPDEDAASALDLSARRAAERGAPVAAAQAHERAAALSVTPEARSRRLTAAGRTASAGGRHAHALELLEQASEVDDPDLRGAAVERLAMVSLYEAGNARTAYRLLEGEAERLAATEPLRAASVLADAGVAATTIGDCRLALATAERARDLLGTGGDGTERAQVLSILGWSLTMRGESGRARELLAEVDELLPDVDPFSPAAQSIALALNSRIPSEEYERAREECGAIVAGCREAGMLGMLPFPMAVEADACHRLGDWDAAAERSTEAVELAEEIGQRGPLAQALVIRVWLLAGRGDEAGARAAAERALAISEPADFGAITMFVLAGLGFLELGLSRVDEAIETLERVAAIADESGFDEPTLIPWAPDLVEAYVQTGRSADARRAAATLAGQCERAGGAFARALAARADGLVGERFDEAFSRALELHEQRPAPFERARTELAFGTRLHRARRRVEARTHLREALEAFEDLGAAPWAARARAELRAAGAIERARVYGPDELTAQEMRVALAVARGAKNREVAAELYLSPKTIEFHLGRVYRKLGIHSRAELATLVAGGALEQPQAQGR